MNTVVIPMIHMMKLLHDKLMKNVQIAKNIFKSYEVLKS